jgi:hypothetical protein
MKTRPLLSCQLKNGLTLLCIDQSKKLPLIAGTSALNVQITIPVEKKWFSNHPRGSGNVPKDQPCVGKKLFFSRKKKDNFISDDVKDAGCH